jgi:hypothetical protein
MLVNNVLRFQPQYDSVRFRTRKRTFLEQQGYSEAGITGIFKKCQRFVNQAG